MHILNYSAMHVAQSVWETIDEGFSLKRTIGEESITDLFLLKMTRLTKGHLGIKDYTKPEENADGGDWAWLFLYPDGKAIGFRVQAKVMYMDQRHRMATQDDPFYDHLHYSPINKLTGKKFPPGEQTRRLIASSSRDKFIPIYCLYTSYSSAFSNLSRCSYLSNDLEKGFGVTVISAHDVIGLSHRTKNLSLFSDKIHSLPCLFEVIHSPLALLAHRMLGISRDERNLYYIQPDALLENKIYKFFLDLNETQLSDLPVDGEGNNVASIQWPDRLSRLTVFSVSDDLFFKGSDIYKLIHGLSYSPTCTGNGTSL